MSFRYIVKLFSNTSNNHVFVSNPNYNAILAFANGCISRVNGGARSRERWFCVSMDSD